MSQTTTWAKLVETRVFRPSTAVLTSADLELHHVAIEAGVTLSRHLCGARGAQGPKPCHWQGAIDSPLRNDPTSHRSNLDQHCVELAQDTPNNDLNGAIASVLAASSFRHNRFGDGSGDVSQDTVTVEVNGFGSAAQGFLADPHNPNHSNSTLGTSECTHRISLIESRSRGATQIANMQVTDTRNAPPRPKYSTSIGPTPMSGERRAPTVGTSGSARQAGLRRCCRWRSWQQHFVLLQSSILQPTFLSPIEFVRTNGSRVAMVTETRAVLETTLPKSMWSQQKMLPSKNNGNPHGQFLNTDTTEVAQRQALMIQKMPRVAEVSQLQSVEVVGSLVVAPRQISVVQKKHTTKDITQVQHVEMQAVEKAIEIPQLQIVAQIVEIPVLQTSESLPIVSARQEAPAERGTWFRLERLSVQSAHLSRSPQLPFVEHLTFMLRVKSMVLLDVAAGRESGGSKTTCNGSERFGMRHW